MTAPSRTGRLAGRVAFITGAARGQGRAHAVRFAEEGADLGLVDACVPITELGYPPSTSEDLAETAALARAAGARVVDVEADVRDLPALQAAVHRTYEELGGLHLVVANAGISAWGRLWEITEEQWDAVVGTNLTGVWHTLKATIPAIIRTGDGGSIVLISSVAGLKPLPGQAHYGAAKHGVVGLMGAAAVELGTHRIRVNSVHPWAVDTPMARDTILTDILRQHPEYVASFGQVLHEPQIAKPRDIADAVLWLASDESRTVTGVALPVDLGATRR